MPLVRSFPPIASKDARLLVLGSMPGTASLAAGQYYAHPRNAFWPIAAAVLGFDPQAPYRQRVAALRSRGVAVWDVLACCERDGSLDSDIAPTSMQTNDFATFFARHRGVRDVLCNGGTSFRLFSTRVAPQLAAAPRVHRLPSTSPAHAGRSFAQKLAAWRIALAGATLALALPLAAQGEAGGSKQVAPAAPRAGDERPQPGDAAPAYRRLVKLMRERFGEYCDRLPETELPGGTPDDKEVLSEPWRAAVAAAAPAFGQWELAIGQPRCRFRATSSQPLMSEFMQEMIVCLQKFRWLLKARALQAIAGGDADTAVATVEGLLAHALHLQQEPGSIAWLIAAGVEGEAVALHEAIVGAFDDAAKERSRAVIRRHLERRGGIAAAGAAARIEMFRMFDGAVAHMQRGDGAKAKLLRELYTDVRRHFTANIDPIVLVLERANQWTPEVRADVAARAGELDARFQERLAIMKVLMRDGDALPAGLDPAADLGLVLANLIGVNLEGLADGVEQARERLAAAAR